jgi:transcriptional regulator with XRE-family HTH domain
VIRSTRQGDELSQQEFAAKLGISKQHLCDIEKGRKTVSPARAWGWAKALGYHPKQWAELALQDMLDKDGLKGVTVRLDVA